MTHQAVVFLRLLDPSPEARFNVECYTDVPKGDNRSSPDPLSRQYKDLTIEQVETLIPEMTSLNAQGAGVFVAMNQFDGRRKLTHLARIRGVHADLDGVAPEVMEAMRSKLGPTIVVQSSGPNNQHWYWLLADGEEMSETDAKAINRSLASMGADSAAVDLTRLLRLPGFQNMKHREGDVENA